MKIFSSFSNLASLFQQHRKCIVLISLLSICSLAGRSSKTCVATEPAYVIGKSGGSYIHEYKVYFMDKERRLKIMFFFLFRNNWKCTIFSFTASNTIMKAKAINFLGNVNVGICK